MLRLDLGSSGPGKYDKAATNADWVPQGTPLAAAALPWIEMLPKKMAHQHCPAPSLKLMQLKSTGPLAQHTPLTVQLAPPPAVQRSANRARPRGGPRSKSQILEADRSSHECSPFSHKILAISSPTTSTQKVSSGEHLSINSMVEDTIARSAAGSPAISVWQRAAIRIPSDR
jgi:hypothetical protein